jgi:putative ABC transport system permease protein
MFKNYLKTAFRNLAKNKGFTFINVFGLALGLATCMLIVFYVFDELSYDRFNVNADRIYRVNNDIKFGGNTNSYAVSPAPLAAAFQAELPQVEQTVRFRVRGGFTVKKGLQDFAYRQDIQWWVFVSSGATAILIAFVTISFQSIKAALSNPVTSLRSE